ncbi:MAG: aminopeptidase P family protein [Rickettsiales bacterium]|nr:aminopeptidase P family protein [Rickettsiales bacterium]
MTMQEYGQHATRLDQLIEAIRAQKLDAFIQPINDGFQGEYVPARDQRLPWVTGFNGSAGTGLFLSAPFEGKDAILFVDGRYTIQAAQEVDPDCYHIINIADKTLGQWLADHSEAIARIGFDPWLHTNKQIEGLVTQLSGKELSPIPNPIDTIWTDQPEPPAMPVEAYAIEYAGVQATDKVKAIADELAKRKADAWLLCLPDGINWLLNIRGEDIPYNPLALCYALVHADATVTVIAHDVQRFKPALNDTTKLVELESFITKPELLFAKDSNILCDAKTSAHWFFQTIESCGATVSHAPDATLLPKAIKNDVEIEHMREVHQSDGRAVSALLDWLKQEIEIRDVTEIEAAQRLEKHRTEVADHVYRGPSFTTISGAGPHGAIVHYRVTEESNRPILNNELYLVDSGGQYFGGTTDITRTIVRGEPTEEMIDRYTRVLKGHIALATAIFPKGTTGAQLDVLARHALWKIGCDYQHGTGHGVGSYLCVHEGPQGISKRAQEVALAPGMILSNEPGYYKTGEYGIRIENLILVVDRGVGPDGMPIYGFETLTLVPMEESLINRALLSDDEIAWLDDYHKQVERNNAA